MREVRYRLLSQALHHPARTDGESCSATLVVSR
jgi:hypothetical protein